MIVALDGEVGAAALGGAGVGAGVAEDFGHGLTGLERLDGGLGVVDDVAVAAIGIEREAAVGASQRCTQCAAGSALADAGDGGNQAVVGFDVAGQGRGGVFVDGAGVVVDDEGGTQGVEANPAN